MAPQGQSNAQSPHDGARANNFQTTSADRRALFQRLGSGDGSHPDSFSRPIRSADDLNPEELAECFRIFHAAVCATSDSGPPSVVEMEKFLKQVFNQHRAAIDGGSLFPAGVCIGPRKIDSPTPYMADHDLFSSPIGTRFEDEDVILVRYKFHWESDPYKLTISIVEDGTEPDISHQCLAEYDWSPPTTIGQRASEALQELSNQISRATENTHIETAKKAAAYFIGARSSGLSMQKSIQNLDRTFFHSSRVPTIFPVLPMPSRSAAPRFRI